MLAASPTNYSALKSDWYNAPPAEFGASLLRTSPCSLVRRIQGVVKGLLNAKSMLICGLLSLPLADGFMPNSEIVREYIHPQVSHPKYDLFRIILRLKSGMEVDTQDQVMVYFDGEPTPFGKGACLVKPGNPALGYRRNIWLEGLPMWLPEKELNSAYQSMLGNKPLGLGGAVQEVCSKYTSEFPNIRVHRLTQEEKFKLTKNVTLSQNHRGVVSITQCPNVLPQEPDMFQLITDLEIVLDRIIQNIIWEACLEGFSDLGLEGVMEQLQDKTEAIIRLNQENKKTLEGSILVSKWWSVAWAASFLACIPIIFYDGKLQGAEHIARKRIQMCQQKINKAKIQKCLQNLKRADILPNQVN